MVMEVLLVIGKVLCHINVHGHYNRCVYVHATLINGDLIHLEIWIGGRQGSRSESLVKVGGGESWE